MKMETHFAETRLRTRNKKENEKRKKRGEFPDTLWRTTAMNFSVVVKMGARVRKKKWATKEEGGERTGKSHQGPAQPYDTDRSNPSHSPCTETLSCPRHRWMPVNRWPFLRMSSLFSLYHHCRTFAAIFLRNFRSWSASLFFSLSLPSFSRSHPGARFVNARCGESIDIYCKTMSVYRVYHIDSHHFRKWWRSSRVKMEYAKNNDTYKNGMTCNWYIKFSAKMYIITEYR